LVVTEDVDHRLFRLGRQRGHREGRRRQPEPGEDVDLVLDHQLLRQPLAHVAGRARAVVLHDQFHLAAAVGVALGCQIELHAVFDLLAIGRERSRHGQHEADLDGIGRQRAAREDGSEGHRDQLFVHTHAANSDKVEYVHAPGAIGSSVTA
jgi:hypothetical protein